MDNPSLPPLPKNPTIYQINTRILLRELSITLNRKATLKDLPDKLFYDLKHKCMDFVWFLGVWQTGPRSRLTSKRMQLDQYDLPDVTDDDITGSPFAISDYTLHSDFGKPEELLQLKTRLHQNGMRLMLDFVPNHVGLDHPWAVTHLHYFITGTESDMVVNPQNWTKINDHVIAYGRDPYFPGWADTLQLNYREKDLQEEMYNILCKLSTLCDGVRCDMSMLIMPEIFQKTWGEKSLPKKGNPVDSNFWSERIPDVKKKNPNFIFMAEVYWDMEWELQQHGFDYTYDKRLYDRLRSQNVNAITGHLKADPEFMNRSVRFLENHDEPRAATAFPLTHFCAAIITFTVPGMHFFHDGQFEGCTSKISMHVGRKQKEHVNTVILEFYNQLLTVISRDSIRNGSMQLCGILPAWDGNGSFNNFIAYTMTSTNNTIRPPPLFIVVNFGTSQAQCYTKFGGNFLENFRSREFLTFRDLMKPGTEYVRQLPDLDQKGMFFDIGPLAYHIFEIS